MHVGHIYVEVKDNLRESVLTSTMWVLEMQLRLSGKWQVLVSPEALSGL